MLIKDIDLKENDEAVKRLFEKTAQVRQEIRKTNRKNYSTDTQEFSLRVARQKGY